MIRVVLAEEHGLQRAGLAALLESSPEALVVAATAELGEAPSLARASRADVVILGAAPDFELATTVTRALALELPTAAVVLLWDGEAPQRLREALAAGVHGCISGESPLDEIVAVLRAVREGRRLLPPRLAERLIEAVAGPRVSSGAPPGGLASLSQREREVMALVARGKTNLEIGIILGLSHHTVSHHRRRTMAKLGLGGVTELVRFAAQHGLIDSDGGLDGGIDGGPEDGPEEGPEGRL